MTTEELAAIRKDVEYAASDYSEYYDADGEVCATVQEHAPRLLAEVARLRAGLEVMSRAQAASVDDYQCPQCERLAEAASEVLAGRPLPHFDTWHTPENYRARDALAGEDI